VDSIARYPKPPVDHVLCTIDPGKRACGVALWDVTGTGSTLRWCGLVEQKDGNPHKLVSKIIRLKKNADFFVYYVEDPQLYVLNRKPHDDLKSLKKVVATLEQEGARPLYRIRPVKWKGNLPKPIHHERVLRVLSAKEKKSVPKDHNVIDAVALGLYALGKTGRGAVEHALPPKKTGDGSF
jgi:hypothetical protein